MDKVLHALSGKERTILFLREYKDGVTAEPNASFLTGREFDEYRRLYNIIRFCNDELGDLVLILREQVTEEELRFNAMRLMVIHADDLWLLGQYVEECVPEPVTQSEAKEGKREPRCGLYVYDDDRADDVAVMQEDRRMIGKITGRGYRLKLPLGLSDVSKSRRPRPTRCG